MPDGRGNIVLPDMIANDFADIFTLPRYL